VGTFLTAEQIVPLMLGPGFEMSVSVLKILAWLPLVSFVAWVNGNFLTATGREKMYVVTQGLFALLRVVLAVIVVPRYGYIGAAYAMLVPVGIEFVFYSVLCHSMLKLRPPWRKVLTTGLAALLMAAGVYAALQVGLHVVAIILLVAPVVYGAALYILRVVRAEDLLLFRQAIKLRRSGTES
jgi:O-antigen/teichoic acid export membrane protein